jgi:hypothetical protein
MPYRILADTVVIVHFGFIVFVAAGGLLAWRWPGLVWGLFAMKREELTPDAIDR